MTTNPRTHRLAVASLLLAATLWGIVWYPLRLLEQAGLQGLWSTLILYCAAACVGAVLARGHWREAHGNLGWLAVLTLGAGWCNTAFILAVLEGEVMRVLLLFYLAPAWTLVLARLFLDERIGAAAAVSIAVALCGAGLMLWSPEIGLPWPVSRADLLALSSGMAFALSNVAIRRLQSVSVRVKTALSWYGVVAIAGIGLVAGVAPVPAVGAGTLVAAVALGLFAMTVMTLAVQYGVTHLPAHRSAVILLFELVVGAVSAAWLAGEVMGLREWAGGLLIAGAAWQLGRSGQA